MPTCICRTELSWHGRGHASACPLHPQHQPTVQTPAWFYVEMNFLGGWDDAGWREEPAGGGESFTVLYPTIRAAKKAVREHLREQRLAVKEGHLASADTAADFRVQPYDPAAHLARQLDQILGFLERNDPNFFQFNEMAEKARLQLATYKTYSPERVGG